MNAITGFVRRSDVSLFYLFNRRLHCTLLDLLMKHITHLGSTTFSTAMALFLYFNSNPRIKNIGIQMIVTLIATTAIVQAIKRIVNRPRPYITLSDIIPINPPNCKYSFPSGHTCAAFSLAFVLSNGFPAVGVAFIGLAVLVALSRVYLGVHYPTDTVIGTLIAFGTFKAILLIGLI